MIHNEGLKDRARAVGITSKIYSKNQITGSILKVEGKQYYDFKLTVEVLVKSKGIAGVVFRMKDAFNYYAFYIDKSSGWKALVKVTNGVQTFLSKVRDGGILVNNWHRIEITTIASHIRVFIYDLEQKNKTSSEKIIEGTDTTFASGSVGLFVNMMEGFYFDNLQVVANRCWTPWIPSKGLKIATPLSAVYYENFSGTFSEKFNSQDSDAMQDGPSEWKMNQYASMQQGPGLYQNSLVFDNSPTRRPTMALLRKKLFTNGGITVSFVPMNSDGIVSIIFKYRQDKAPTGSTTEMFYIFEMINSPSNPQFVLRRFLNGIVKELYSIDKPVQNLLGYKPSLRHTVLIESLGENIKIKLSVVGSEMVELLSIKDSAIGSGLVGVGTFKVKCNFSAIEIFPPFLQLTESDKNKILTTDGNEIYFPSMQGLVVRNGSNDNKPLANNASEGNTKNNGKTSGMTSGDKTSSSNTAVGWKTCIKHASVKDRNLYCERSFNFPVSQTKCKVSN